MDAKVIDVARVTPDGDLELSAAVKARLRDLWAAQPEVDVFSVYEDRGTLILVPRRADETPAYVPRSDEVAEAVTCFRERMERYDASPVSEDEDFIGGLTYRQYFALSDDEAAALWDRLAAGAVSMKDLPVIEVKSDARVPARQERRS